MTGRPSEADRTPEAGSGPGATASEPRPREAYGLFRFALEGRTAPGLFVAGWLATLVGGIGAFVGLLAGQTLDGAILFVAGLAVMLGGLLLLGGSQVVERRVAGLAYVGPSPILVFGTVIVGLYLAVVVVVTPLRLANIALDGPGLSLLGVAIQAVVVVALIRVMVVGSGALSWRDMGIRPGLVAAIGDGVWGGAFALPAILVTSIVVAGLVSIVGGAPESPLPPTGTPGGLAINLLAGAVIVPAYEELLFRGFATTAWARAATPLAAITRSAVLFALAHVLTQGGADFGQALGLAIVAAGSRLPVAFVLGWVYLRRRSLWASIGLHATFNTVLLVLGELALRG